MSIEPIKINIREPHDTKTRDKTFRQIIKSKILKVNSKKKNLSFIKRIYKFLSLVIICLRQIFARMLQQKKHRFKSQLEVFEGSMKYFILIGNCFAIFPILGKKSRTRYQFLSWRYFFSFIIWLSQFFAAILCFIAIFKTTITIRKFAYISFYGTTCLSSLLIMSLATKWHVLVKKVETANLNEYTDSSVQFKCKIASLIFLTLAVLDHVLSNVPKYLEVLFFHSDNNTVYEQYIVTSYYWFFEIGLPYALPFGIMLPILNLIVAVNWSYCHIFVICMSLYLSSILKQINKKIKYSEGKYLSASYWRVLRQDYNRTTKLIRSFDEVINSIVFSSFASNLFFVCLQIYYVLRKDATAQHSSSLYTDESSRGPHHIYQEMFVSIYFVYSSIFVIIRTFIVSIIAAEVHSASLEIAPILYSVPSTAYCMEVQRFIEQIHGDRVALTGLNFFYVTKELVLSMVGTIITYELVLLQLN